MSDRSNMWSLTIALYGSWHPRELFALMTTIELKAFIDESGTHGSGLTVMAGWLGHADRWVEFDKRWRSVLIQRGLPYIHAIDLKQGRRAFKDKTRWPLPRRIALVVELGKLAEDHALCSLSVLLSSADYEAVYIGGDKDFRKHRSAADSKYGVCARVYLSMLSELVERYAGPDGQVTVVFEAGAKGQNAIQTILADMYDVAPDRARFINPTKGFARKALSPGVQAADCLAYPVYVHEHGGTAEISGLDEGFPESLPQTGMAHLRAPIRVKTLRDLKEGQIAMSYHRRRLGRHWVQLDGFPRGWAVQPLEIGGFVLTPPRPPQPRPEAASPPETDEPVGFVRLECE
jgi:hypothetical protein